MDEPILQNELTGELPAEAPAGEIAAEVTEAVGETAEVAEEAAENAEETIEETAEAVEDAGEEAGEEETGEDDPLAHAFENYVPEAPKKKNWPIVILAVLLAVVFVGGLLWAFGAFGRKDEPEPGTSGTVATDTVAMKSENYSVTTGMMAFDMEYWYQSFQNYYSYYLPALGLDTSKPLKDQPAYTGEGNWLDFFADYARKDAEYMLLLNEEARKNGLTLDDEAKAAVEQYMTETDFSTFHNGVAEADVREFWTLYQTAMMQEKAIYDSFAFTDEDVEQMYQASPAAYQVCDYATVFFSVGENGQFATTDEAAAEVARLTACTDAASFGKAAVDYLVSTGDYETREEAQEAYEANYVNNGAAYSAEDGISDWLFAADTAVGDVKTVNNTSGISVYMLTGAPRRNESRTVNVRRILLTADGCGSEDAAAQKAEKLLTEWQNGEATSESFATLAAANSEDGSSTEGGLIADITPGQTVPEFNDWCFDAARRHGDSGIVKSTYGYHVMYFEDSTTAWYSAAKTALEDTTYDKIYASLREKYPISINENALTGIEL